MRSRLPKWVWVRVSMCSGCQHSQGDVRRHLAGLGASRREFLCSGDKLDPRLPYVF